MFGFSKFKGWLIAAGMAFVAGVAVLARVFTAGKESAQLDSMKEGAKQDEKFDQAITAGHVAGNAPRVPIDSDPNNRANRRRSED